MQSAHILPGPSTPRALVLTLTYPHRVSYYDDWSDAFHKSHHFSSTVRNILAGSNVDISRELDEYDVIVLLHSCNADTLEYFDRLAGPLGQRKRAKLVSFIGNEFNSPYISKIELARLLRLSKVDLIASQLLPETAKYLYETIAPHIISMPHALNPEIFAPGPPHSSRQIDVGVKGYRYPPYIGDDDRNCLLKFVKDNARRFAITVDISEDKRLPRNRWADFLKNCRGTASSEAGSWFVEPNDELMNRIYAFLSASRSGFVIRNSSSVRRAARLMPMWLKATLWPLLSRGPVKFEILDDYNTSFAKLDERFFRHAARSPVYGKAISSRHFDAIGTKTCLIMQRGRFNDVLVPDQHYIALEPDFSNAEEAFRRFKDPRERQTVVDSALEHVLSGHTYVHRLASLRSALDLNP